MKRLRAAFLLLLLAPFALFQLVAAGAMPVATPDGFAMVLCTGGDVVAGVMDADGVFHPSGPDDPAHSAGQDCPWALAHAPAIDAALRAEVVADAVTAVRPDLPVPAFRRLPDADRRPPVRAPPVTA